MATTKKVDQSSIDGSNVSLKPVTRTEKAVS
jgi:hypothetical protein